MTRVLVTGASGFIGSHLVEALQRRGDQVACLVRPTSTRDRLNHLGLTLVEGDVTDRASLAAALESGQAVADVLERFKTELRFACFGVGAKSIAELRTKPVLRRW